MASKVVPQSEAGIAESAETIEALQAALEALREAGLGGGAFLQLSSTTHAHDDLVDSTLTSQADATSGPVGIVATELDNYRELYDSQKSDLLTFKENTKTTA